MKELTCEQVNEVSGGFKPPTDVWPGMSARLALTTFRGLSLVGIAFSAGFKAGKYLNENTPIQKKIASLIDSMAG
jgi:nucleoside recognition membrane protein YjiH